MSLIPHIDISQLIQAFGYLGLFAVIFAETGLFFGFFLPGDSLLFTAGLLASQGVLNIWVLVPAMILGAALGDSFGYWFGAKVGPRLFAREDSFFFHKHHVERTQKFYEKYGVKTVMISRFLPVVRTFAPILAGVGGMPYGTFLRYNIIGGTLWGGGLTLAGYFLGSTVPNIENYLLPIIIGIIIISFLPIIREIINNKKGK